jgi:enamine deaminase RidA (YjgF/YER057c/UK114 family)
MSAAEESRLAELGLTVPPVVPPVAAYVPAVRSGSYVYTSGQLPMVDGALLATGKVGADVTPSRPRSSRRSARSTPSPR